MEHISGGMHQCSVDGGLTLLSVSPSFLNLCGYSREELRTRFQDRLMELICPQDRTQVLQWGRPDGVAAVPRHDTYRR